MNKDKATYKGQPFAIEATGGGQDFPQVNSEEATRMMSATFNDATSQRHHINEVRFSFYNHPVLLRAFEEGRAVDLTDIPKQREKGVLIIGSGPTLNEALPKLKDWRGEIVCSTSQAPTLLRWGVVPDHIIALDADSHPAELEAPGSWADRKSYLHVHPGVNPELIKWWPGKLALFRKLQPQTPFYANEQSIGYSTLGSKIGHRYDGGTGEPLIKAQVPMLACVAAAQICIAKHLGYFQQYLVGIDQGFPEDKERFTASRWHEDTQSWEDVVPELVTSYNRRNLMTDPIVETEFEGLKSTPMMIFYGYQIVIAWRITETNIINTSNKGLLRLFPYVPLDEVFKHQTHGVKGFSLAKIRDVAELHLAKQNIYFLWVGKGVMPHEFKDPLHEIPRLIDTIERTMKNTGRGKEFNADANRKRIERLFKRVSDTGQKESFMHKLMRDLQQRVDSMRGDTSKEADALRKELGVGGDAPPRALPQQQDGEGPLQFAKRRRWFMMSHHDRVEEKRRRRWWPAWHRKAFIAETLRNEKLDARLLEERKHAPPRT